MANTNKIPAAQGSRNLGKSLLASFLDTYKGLGNWKIKEGRREKLRKRNVKEL